MKSIELINTIAEQVTEDDFIAILIKQGNEEDSLSFSFVVAFSTALVRLGYQANRKGNDMIISKDGRTWVFEKEIEGLYIASLARKNEVLKPFFEVADLFKD